MIKEKKKPVRPQTKEPLVTNVQWNCLCRDFATRPRILSIFVTCKAITSLLLDEVNFFVGEAVCSCATYDFPGATGTDILQNDYVTAMTKRVHTFVSYNKKYRVKRGDKRQRQMKHLNPCHDKLLLANSVNSLFPDFRICPCNFSFHLSFQILLWRR